MEQQERVLCGLKFIHNRWPEVAKRTLQKFVEDGKLPAVRIGSRFFVPLSEILRVEKEGLK